MNRIIRTIIFSIVFIFLGCKQSQEASVSNYEADKPELMVSLYDSDHKLVSKITDENKASQIVSLLETKKVMLEKYQPIFKMQLVIEKNDTKEVWLFAKPKYLKRKSSKDNLIYYVEKHSGLMKAFSL